MRLSKTLRVESMSSSIGLNEAPPNSNGARQATDQVAEDLNSYRGMLSAVVFLAVTR